MNKPFVHVCQPLSVARQDAVRNALAAQNVQMIELVSIRNVRILVLVFVEPILTVGLITTVRFVRAEQVILVIHLPVAIQFLVSIS